MAIYPKANVKLLKNNFTKLASNKNAVILHSTASNSDSQYNWFNNTASLSSSHFHIAKDGVVEQYIDTNYISWANSNANHRSVTIETAGVQTKDEPWTPEQVRSIIDLISWITKEHKISIRQMESSLASEVGIGWHRLGCDGNFPKTGILRGRNQIGKGESWSKAYGKVCPGTLRIQQIPGIITEVKKKNSVVNVIVDKVTNVVNKKKWPNTNLVSSTKLNSNITSAWNTLMKSIKMSGSTEKMMQTWLKSKGYYSGRLDGSFGTMSVESLQALLNDSGFYKGTIDGSRGGMTVKAEVAFLNDQRRFF